MARKPKKKNSKEFQQLYKKKHSPMASISVALAVIIIVAIMAMGYSKLSKRAREYEAQIDELSTEIKDLKGVNSQLEEEKNEMDTKEYKEKVAREQLGMIGEDEYVLEESDGSETTSAPKKKKKN